MLTQVTSSIAFIGGGNMAQALIVGLLAKGLSANQLHVVDTDLQKLQIFAQQGIHTYLADDVALAISQVDTVILAVKPQVLKQVLLPLKSFWQNHLVISIVAGITTDSLQQWLANNVSVVRAMPNTPAMVQQGATGLYATTNVSQAQKQLAEQILSATGLALWVDNEQLLHSVTAISGSAPAYFFYLLEHMISTGQKLGLSHEQATALAIQTAIGSAKMAQISADSPAQLRQKVTSPNGTTQSAIETMQTNQMDSIIEQAMHACFERSQQISKEFG